MNIWDMKYWEIAFKKYSTRKGLILIFESEVALEVKNACKDYCRWLRREYNFPIRVRIYIKASEKIKAADGEFVSATFVRPADSEHDPYARISTGDYHELKERCGHNDALVAILRSITHELTHYFQWINCIELTERGYEQQARYYAREVVYTYSQTCDWIASKNEHQIP